MLHKKGDCKQPENYRSIALLSNVLKLLTQMITKRLVCWCESNDIISESQSGFRPGRGCVDNIFTLSSVVSLHLIKRRKLYTAFVDFRSAFSEVDHNLLWVKMFHSGVSGKMIRLMKKIYDKANVQIKINNEVTSPVKITKGVMEGDSASPQLFLLFLNDLEEFMRIRGARGVPINHVHEILLLLYCDDLIIFASDRIELQRKLNLLHNYCEANMMQVNIAKTKVVIFRQGGKLSKLDRFYYKGDVLEISNQYNYLGVLFSSHGVFYKAAEQATSKGRMAVSNIRTIMCKSKMESWDARMKLYSAVVKATLLYGVEVWGLRYGDHAEKCQLYFIKSIFCLPRNTPNYVVSLEMGLVKIEFAIFKQAFEWWLKLLEMPPN